MQLVVVAAAVLGPLAVALVFWSFLRRKDDVASRLAETQRRAIEEQRREFETQRDAAVQSAIDHLLAHNRATLASAETGCFMRDCRTKGETPLHRAAAFETRKISLCCLPPAPVSMRKTQTARRRSRGQVGTFARAPSSICFATVTFTFIRSAGSRPLANQRLDRWKAH